MPDRRLLRHHRNGKYRHRLLRSIALPTQYDYEDSAGRGELQDRKTCRVCVRICVHTEDIEEKIVSKARSNVQIGLFYTPSILV